VTEQLRQCVLDDLKDWLRTDGEYEALYAIQKSIEANPQLVPKRDVPQRLLKALLDAVDRFAVSPENKNKQEEP